MDEIDWTSWPTTRRPPKPARDLARIFESKLPVIASTSAATRGISRNATLDRLREPLAEAGWLVDSTQEPLELPVLFGPRGSTAASQRVDAYHDESGTVLQVCGAEAREQATALVSILTGAVVVECRHLVVATRRSVGTGSADDHAWFSGWVEQLVASDRLELPFESLTAIGY